LKKIIFWFFRFLISLMALSLIIIVTHNLNKEITTEDIKYIKKFVSDKNITNAENYSSYVNSLSFEKQVALIKKIQKNVITIAPIGRGIPHNKPRNPKDLYLHKKGLCYDRSNVLEKILESMGFKTRHLSLFAKMADKSLFSELTTQGIRSHSIFEVQTNQGWLIVDTNSKWVSLNSDNIPISMGLLKKNGYNVVWKETPPLDYYTSPYTHIYGLYSRHGKFFKPYNSIPDFRVQELLYNF